MNNTTEAPNLKATLEQIASIFQDARTAAAPLLDALQPQLDAAKLATEYGLTAESTPEQIIDAFANKIDLSVPARALVPTVLNAGAPDKIRAAGEKLTAANQTIGALVGEVAGIVVGLM